MKEYQEKENEILLRIKIECEKLLRRIAAVHTGAVWRRGRAISNVNRAALELNHEAVILRNRRDHPEFWQA